MRDARKRIAELEAALEAMIRLHNGDGPGAVPEQERIRMVEAARRTYLAGKA
ncbi:MAG: hypothetical protein KJZ80_19070 [Hyphomicrobiaceae bacterium]|nr:hypothetical protein [Hyphomicrobiaceae bacterium]